jgi:hypothetical protein
MCQINTFIQLTNETADAYELIDIDSPLSRAYLRFAMHITHESMSGVTIAPDNVAEFRDSVNAVLNQGLCRALGRNVLPNCRETDLSYLNRHLFAYVGHPMHSDEGIKRVAEDMYRRGLNESLVAVGHL